MAHLGLPDMWVKHFQQKRFLHFGAFCGGDQYSPGRCHGPCSLHLGYAARGQAFRELALRRRAVQALFRDDREVIVHHPEDVRLVLDHCETWSQRLGLRENAAKLWVACRRASSPLPAVWPAVGLWGLTLCSTGASTFLLPTCGRARPGRCCNAWPHSQCPTTSGSTWLGLVWCFSLCGAGGGLSLGTSRHHGGLVLPSKELLGCIIRVLLARAPGALARALHCPLICTAAKRCCHLQESLQVLEGPRCFTAG